MVIAQWKGMGNRGWGIEERECGGIGGRDR
jgi:hypothetical protein